MSVYLTKFIQSANFCTLKKKVGSFICNQYIRNMRDLFFSVLCAINICC